MCAGGIQRCTACPPGRVRRWDEDQRHRGSEAGRHQRQEQPEREWLADVASVALVQSVRDSATACKNWFASLSGKRKGRKLGPPRFKSRKDNRQAIRLTRNGFSIRRNRKLYIAKIGELKVAWSRDLPSVPSSVTIIKDSAGRSFASFVVEVDQAPLAEVDVEVGIDLGLATFAVFSDGRVVESPRFLRRAERTLRKAQQNLSRKEKGSRNRAKARWKVARAHARVADSRRNFVHQQSTAIIRDNHAVYVEDLV
ncbi:transposase [Rhodococcus sp. HNM0569]|uniref:RNA-guided endonuclease InsQ/TnpB family protein n=1 Tax=Rhodococcus sp. HNM0569 TaxID=2716340 RepID=UPI001F0E2D82|nr:transposase [Rhodococcus sp. HNM0569]